MCKNTHPAIFSKLTYCTIVLQSNGWYLYNNMSLTFQDFFTDMLTWKKDLDVSPITHTIRNGLLSQRSKKKKKKRKSKIWKYNNSLHIDGKMAWRVDSPFYFLGPFLSWCQAPESVVLQCWSNSPVLQSARPPVRLRLPVTQESTKSLKALLVLHAKTFELTKLSIMQMIILK